MTTGTMNAKTFFSRVDSFIDYRKTVYESSLQTIRSNLTDLRLFDRFITEHGYSVITGETVMSYQMYLKTDRGNSGSSINRKLFTLRSYGRFLKVSDVTGSGTLPFRDVLKIRTGYGNGPQALTKRQVKTFFDTIDRTTCLGIRDYCVFALMYNLGLRAGEVYGLGLNDMDLEGDVLTVTGKGRKRRNLHVTRETKDIINDWLAVRQCFLHGDTVTRLFVSKKGNPLAIRTMEDNFKKILRKSGIRTYFNATCHTLRHSFASHLNDKNVDIIVLQNLLGHSSQRSTQIYIHPSQDRVRAALEELPAVKYVTRLIGTGKIRFQGNYVKSRNVTADVKRVT
jgi:site-specific recombinase XerD